MYEPQAINERDKQILATLSTNMTKNLARMEDDIVTIQQALQVYKSALTDSMELSIEEADIICRYSTKPTLGSYNLPSVLVGTRANYDLGQIKDDNKRMEELKDMTADAKKQSDAYLKILTSAFNDLQNEMKKVKLFNANVEQALEILRNSGQ